MMVFWDLNKKCNKECVCGQLGGGGGGGFLKSAVSATQLYLKHLQQFNFLVFFDTSLSPNHRRLLVWI